MRSKSSLLINTSLLLAIGASLLTFSNVNAQSPTQNTWGWKEIAVGVTSNLAIRNDGSVWQWGESSDALVPRQVHQLTDIKSIAVGQSHSIALSNDGSVWTWGSNHNGQLGNGTKTSRSEPHKVDHLSNVVAVEADWTRSFAVKADGTVWGWGGFYYRDSDGAVHNPETPAQLTGLENVVAVSAGYGSFMALKSDGTVWYYSDQLNQVKGATDMIQIAVGAEYTYGLKEDGTVWYWGSDGNTLSKVNGRSTVNGSAPLALQGIDDVIAVQASAGGPLMLKRDGTVWASGDNVGGQLGIGSYKSSEVPVQVNVVNKATRIAAHGIGFRSMAVRADGTLWSWGIGYTGDGTKWYRTLPVGIPSFTGQTIEKDPTFVEVDGTVLQFEQPPVVVNNRTLVPLRTIFESMGAEVTWDSTTSTVTAVKGNVSIELVVGSPQALLNGKQITLDAPSKIVNNYTLVPVRFIGEAFGAKVDWDADNKTIIITSAA